MQHLLPARLIISHGSHQMARSAARHRGIALSPVVHAGHTSTAPALPALSSLLPHKSGWVVAALGLKAAANPRIVTCSPYLKARGFSVHPRRHPRESPKGLPGPLDVPCRVLITVQHQSTGGAAMGAHAEAFRHARPTAATVLTGICRRNREHLTPGPCCLGFKDGTKRGPARIADALGQVVIPYHVADLQLFAVDRVVLAHQHVRRLVVKVAALPPDMLVLLGTPTHGLGATLTALLPATHPLLRLSELLLRLAIVARILYHVAFSRNEKHLQPDVHAGLPSGEGERRGGHVRTGKRHVPAVCRFRYRDGL